MVIKTVVRALGAAALAVLSTLHTMPVAQAAEPSYTLPLTNAVNTIPVAAEDRTGYNREASFGGWIDADRDGCNTRAEVLLAEAIESPAVSGRCTLTGGLWYSWYDDTEVYTFSARDSKTWAYQVRLLETKRWGRGVNGTKASGSASCIGKCKVTKKNFPGQTTLQECRALRAVLHGHHHQHRCLQAAGNGPKRRVLDVQQPGVGCAV